MLKSAVAGALGVAAVSCLLAWPGYLSYFNILAGKTPVALDSNRDWGTDLYRLKLMACEHEWEPLYTLYFGGIPEQIYLHCSHRLPLSHFPAKGKLALSVNYYVPLKMALERELPLDASPILSELHRRLKTLTYVGSVGTSMVVLDIPEGDRLELPHEGHELLLLELLTPLERKSFFLLPRFDKVIGPPE